MGCDGVMHIVNCFSLLITEKINIYLFFINEMPGFVASACGDWQINKIGWKIYLTFYQNINKIPSNNAFG